MASTRRSFLVLATAQLCLAGCGFHLRGSRTRAADRGSVFVDADPDLSIIDEIMEALSDASFSLTTNRDAASILLRLTGESVVERVVSVTGNGRISELELIHSLNMSVASSVEGDSPVISANQNFNRVEVTREYTFDETGVLGKQNEARILREEMKQDLVRQIVLRSIASLAP